MHLTSDIKFKKLVVIGDRVLIRPSRPMSAQIPVYTSRRASRRKKKCNKVTSSGPDLGTQFLCRWMMNPGNTRMNRSDMSSCRPGRRFERRFPYLCRL
jgi:hypothetical protein